MGSPARQRLLGHLPRWTSNPLALLEEGAQAGGVFSLQLWRKAVVGHSPDWNRFVLGDLTNFRSRGSLSQLSPYLSAGVVALDAPAHRRRRAELNPPFHRRAVSGAFEQTFGDIARAGLPEGDFEATAWAAGVIRQMLTAAFLGPRFPDAVLRSFLAPLDQTMPGPLLRRPIRVRRMEAALRTNFADPAPGTLAAHFAALTGGVEEARVAIAAAYDTTAHTLAFAVSELAARPDLNVPEMTGQVIDETLRLYPAGWIGSRVAVGACEFGGHPIPAGRLVLYSPYLTHRSPALWKDPLQFRPERFAEPLPAWGFIPFSAGERTCLGAALATSMLQAAVGAFAGSSLTRHSGPAVAKAGLTLTPASPVLLRRVG